MLIYDWNGNQKFQVGANEGSPWQERANNTVPSSSERDPIVLGHQLQHLGSFQKRKTPEQCSIHERESCEAIVVAVVITGA